MQDVYHDDLRDFVRHGKLDAYELTDAELARFLELWRWSAYTRRTAPTAPDYDTHDVVNRLERHLYHEFGIEIEYNTRLLLLQQAEPLMYMSVLMSVREAVVYFVWHPMAFFQSLRHIRRARRVKPVLGEQRMECRGYPRGVMHKQQLPNTNLLKRRYWRRLSQHTPQHRLEQDQWW